MDSARRTASIHAPRVPSAHAVASGALISQPLSPDALPRISGRSLRSLVALCSSALTALVAMSRHHGLCSRLRGRLSPRRRRVYATLRRRRARCSVVAFRIASPSNPRQSWLFAKPMRQGFLSALSRYHAPACSSFLQHTASQGWLTPALSARRPY